LVALVSDGVRHDCAAPADNSVRQVLAAVGIPFDAHRHVVVSERGYELDLDAAIGTLPDGSLLTVIDTVRPAAGRTRMGTGHGPAPSESTTLWWLLGAIAVILTGSAALALLSGSVSVPQGSRVLLASALFVASLASAATWVVRARGSSARAVVLIAPITLACTAGLVATPQVASAPHLGVVLALASATIVTMALTIAAGSREMRAVVGTAAVILLILTGVWGLTLMLEWTATAAAAISMGLVAPGIAFIPATIMNVPEGYAINYKHFMSNRWTVRGVVPDDPGEITDAVVRPYIAESRARLTVGTAVLSVVAVLTTPSVAAITRGENLLTSIGAWVLLVSTTLALLLLPRRATSRSNRWVPRSAATAILLQLAILTAVNSEPVTRVILAGALLLGGLLTCVAMITIARGTRVLAWSRIADVVENIAVVLALPAGMIAAGTLEFVRTMVSG
jgi:hypothetical protein